MTFSDEYRRTAADLLAKAGCAESMELSIQWEHLAKCYLRLAEQADKNAQGGLAIEVGPKPTLEGEGA